MIARRQANAQLQSDFYRDQFRKMLRLILVLIGFMFVLLMDIAYFVFFQPPQAFYANTSDGKILSMPVKD